ncbi:hypothetical protein LEAN103870_15250 [Legionella anisa]|uniref:Helix-turn-helix domain-containing protein n=2 Tax=Legionella anisa TaxID=28082 RepID=A0AAX0WZR9_9GAMM|nr:MULTISPECIES: hypothetical protein [Legionella]HAT9164541.1 hypothetical protein [Legionella pneumophila subsp. pneumophila]AOU90872.1 hypothetical protein A9E96_15095 [Legionella pneumophila]AWN76004.1 hypothetical protein DLD14_19175 [Legionella anisa]MCW8449601.1 hypothetical protein [Legionella anisa]MDO5225698.1 hypothetical protein [Legionella pneumophila]
MAIKKGAFELYTQERKLPDKRTSSSGKKNHFFDDIDKESNGTQTVHNQFTNGSSQVIVDDCNLLQNQSEQLETNPILDGECNADDTLNKPRKLNLGSFDNSPQTVHKRFTSDRSEVEITTDKLLSLKSNAKQHNHEKKLLTSFSKIIGNQREIVIALYKNIRLNKSDMTEELTLETIATLTGINPKSLKNTLFRLTSAGVIIRADQKVGRGGWVKYQINSEIIEQIQQADFLTFTKIKR